MKDHSGTREKPWNTTAFFQHTEQFTFLKAAEPMFKLENLKAV